MDGKNDISGEKSMTANEGNQPVQKMSNDGGAMQEDENGAEDELFANTTKRRNLSEEVTNAPVADAAQESSGGGRQFRNLAEVLGAENNRDEDTADTPGIGGLGGRRRTLPVIKKDAVAPMKRGTPHGQRNSTYGTEFPCTQCSNSYKRSESLRNHVHAVHRLTNIVQKKNSFPEIVKNTSTSNIGSVNCSYCTASFFTREACFKHTMEYHKEDIVAVNDLPNAREEEPTSTQRLNVPRYGFARDANGRVLVQVKKDHAQDKDSLDERVKCFKCDKQFKDNQFLKMHMLISHPAPSEDKRGFCDECGEVVRSIDFANHRNTCLSINTRISDAQGSSNNANDSVNRSPFTPPVAKKRRDDILNEMLLDPLRNLRSIPKAEFVHHMIGGGLIVQSDVDENEQRSTTKPKAPRANTQMVIRNLSNSFDKRQSPMTGSPAVDHGTDDSVIIPQFTSTPQRIITSATSVDEDRIEKSSHPLLLGIYLCSQKYPDELMVVWNVSLEEDLVQAMSEVSDKAILCVQKINMEDMFNVNTKQKELLNKSQKINFIMLDDKKLYKQWTSISFGALPTGLEDRIFTRYADVEEIFEDHARKNGKTINNIMRCDGLFPLLSHHLQKKITAFNQ